MYVDSSFFTTTTVYPFLRLEFWRWIQLLWLTLLQVIIILWINHVMSCTWFYVGRITEGDTGVDCDYTAHGRNPVPVREFPMVETCWNTVIQRIFTCICHVKLMHLLGCNAGAGELWWLWQARAGLMTPSGMRTARCTMTPFRFLALAEGAGMRRLVWCLSDAMCRWCEALPIYYGLPLGDHSNDTRIHAGRSLLGNGVRRCDFHEMCRVFLWSYIRKSRVEHHLAELWCMPLLLKCM